MRCRIASKGLNASISLMVRKFRCFAFFHLMPLSIPASFVAHSRCRMRNVYSSSCASEFCSAVLQLCQRSCQYFTRSSRSCTCLSRRQTTKMCIINRMPTKKTTSASCMISSAPEKGLGKSPSTHAARLFALLQKSPQKKCSLLGFYFQLAFHKTLRPVFFLGRFLSIP